MPSKIRGGTADKHLADMHIPRVSALGAGGGAAAATTLILDQFTDTNGTLLTAHTIAPTNTPATSWTFLFGSMDIQSNEANVVADTLTICNPGAAVITVSARMMGGTTLNPKVSDNNNKWTVGLDAAGDAFFIQEANGGSFTTRATTSVPIDTATYYQVSAVMNGTSIAATLDGANAISYSSTFLAADTKVGLRIGTAGLRVDNFQVTTP